MKFSNYLTLLIVVIVGLNASGRGGGDTAGNGGDARVCRTAKNEIFVVELFDFTEGSYVRKIRFDYQNLLDLSVDQINERLLKKLSDLSPVRASILRGKINNFMKNAAWSPKGLAAISDIGSLMKLNLCRVEQLSIQKRDQVTGVYHYLIDDELWKKMIPFNRSGLMFHETLYQEALAQGQSNSIGVRYVNAMLFSNEFMSMDRFDFFRVLIESKLDIEWGGLFWSVQKAGSQIIISPRSVQYPIALEDTGIKIQAAGSQLNFETFKKLKLQENLWDELKNLPVFLILDSRLNILFVQGQLSSHI